jgi:outer membrane protein
MNFMGKHFGWLLGLTLISTPFAQAEVKIGYIDMQKAIQETGLGKKAKKDLEEEYNKKKKDLEKKEADLKKMNEDLEKKALVLSDEVRGKKQQELQAEMLKYRDQVGKSQMEIQKKERDLTVPIVEGLHKIVKQIAENEGFTVVLEKSEQSVMWAKKDIDLTDRVIKEFEKESPKKK